MAPDAAAGAPTVWWLGLWRAGENLYWWTTATRGDGDNHAARRAVQARVSPETWASVRVPPQPASGPAGRARGEPDTAFVVAGAQPWTEVEPLLALLLDGLPGRDETAEQRRRDLERQRARMQQNPPPDQDEHEAYWSALFDIGQQLADLEVTAVAESLQRAWTGPLVDPAANRDLCAGLGRLLLPAVLREYLTAPSAATAASGEGAPELSDEAPPSPPQRSVPDVPTLVIAPGPDLGAVPWELLTVDDTDRRLVEVARVRGGVSPASLVDLPLPAAPHRPQGPVLRVVDPSRSRTRPTALPIYPEQLPDAWRDRHDPARGDVLAGGSDEDAAAGRLPRCSRQQFSALLTEGSWSRLLYLGHVSVSDELSPTAAALEFDPDLRSWADRQPMQTDDGRLLERPRHTHALSARVWLHAPQRWPLPRRVAFIACQADDSRYAEQVGLTLAAIHAGARVITATRWTLPTDQTAGAPGEPQVAAGHGPTTALALAVDEAHGAADPVAALRAWQLRQLRLWRQANTAASRRRHAPLIWAAPVTYVLPDEPSTP
ncbi:CHAT domain-containing protein [Geodermatophilus sp. DF01-2]|uniref:CHAT domain-containing protein n=1 Tax=Geodermatophilus sp. DF01-2 TaxID=2559610 RepID=UPI0010739CF7|nr:CHAT domain-containing protein [Geodermatophilus sp. DF01_2]TFV53908.1 CHAT domain-containing protein [Geodermatophilus sp. DF01_2]